MADAPKDQPPAVNWRFAVPIGMSIGPAIPTSQAVTHALEPSLGHWGAFLVSIVAATAVGVLGALVGVWLLRQGGRT